jgi:methionyl-tRNA formyltransferase
VSDTKKSILFLGSKPIGYACLQHLLSVQESLGVEVAGVLTKSRKEFKGEHDLSALAASHNIPVFPTLDDMPECDIIYSVQYHEILRQQYIDKARQIAVNLHMAPLPEYRGSNQFSFAIVEGKKEFGTTIHRIDPRIDHGDILFEKRFPIPDNTWVAELYRLTEEASVVLFKESLPKIISGDYTLTPQKDFEATRGTSLHFRNEMDALKQIDLAWSAEKIGRHIRAASMPGFEPPYAMVGGQKVYFIPKGNEPA